MTPPDSAEESMTNSGTMGPGDRLQAARIENGMSIEDIAMRMHLSVGIVKSIEENNFDDITAPIFVKGYLRAYARIVSLDENDMIDQYIDFYSEEDPPISSISNMASELSVTDPRIKWTTVIVVLTIGVSLSAWWWNHRRRRKKECHLRSSATHYILSSTLSKYHSGLTPEGPDNL